MISLKQYKLNLQLQSFPLYTSVCLRYVNKYVETRTHAQIHWIYVATINRENSNETAKPIVYAHVSFSYVIIIENEISDYSGAPTTSGFALGCLTEYFDFYVVFVSRSNSKYGKRANMVYINLQMAATKWLIGNVPFNQFVKYCARKIENWKLHLAVHSPTYILSTLTSHIQAIGYMGRQFVCFQLCGMHMLHTKCQPK